MNKDQLNSEVLYRLSIAFVKNLQKQGLISDKEYNKIDTILNKTYAPILSNI